jgi:hypothetical protein
MSDECSLPDPRMDETNGMAPTHEVLEAAGTQPLETARLGNWLLTHSPPQSGRGTDRGQLIVFGLGGSQAGG